MSIEQPPETLLTFPCTFPIKIMGITSDRFEATMLTLAAQYIDGMEKVKVQQKASKNGTYTSITMTFEAQNQKQLDDLYCDFSAHPSVKMVL
ncbi:MAG: DUF493 domain-containing protein [Mariprofundaceae bacterium]|nr:DUF493 domain-containing protein [Mariprofundaceae bacterium]